MAQKLDKVDAVIVGSGWAGGIIAAELTKKGYNVVGLERGVDKDQEDYIGTKDELRFSRRYEMMQHLNKETITSRNNQDATALPVRTNENALFGTNTGGSGVHWNGVNFRFLPYDFEIYSKTVERYGKDKIPKGMTLQDWGITYDELEKYYDRYEKMAGISGEENPIGPNRSDKYPTPPMKDTPAIRLFKKSTSEMGYHPYHIPSANLSEQYKNPDGETINACMYCAFCETYGCDFGAKSDPIITVLKTAKKTGNYELRNEATVTRVMHDGNRATGLLYTDTKTGQEYEQPADIVVLAGFIFTNTRLLLLSDIGKTYNPKTGTGVIGKNFTGHFNNMTYLGARGFFEDKKFNNFMGAGALGATIDDFSGDNIDHSDLDFLHGFEVQIQTTGNRPIATNFVPKGTPSWGKEFKDKSLYYTNRNLYVNALSGSLPWQHNYLDLDPTYTDFLGNPLLRVTYSYTDQDRNLSRYAVDVCEKIMKKMGADTVEKDEITDDIEFNSSFTTGHFGGGAIMGNDPKTSAVNNYSQMWEMDNLFVVGASSFPHFGNYNPTETVGALAYRAAEGIDQFLKDGGGLLVKGNQVKSKT
ncbi:GMC family oxidoreductase [Lentibacillus cibarius]|uniref:GMC family oxidoreductase n=1 Tax=Lentibacillus cibarius TaxID=2583219 RepID=A0A549YJB1_9BACI|nr:GMC family oxidoreductase [Lentibacillus cibarius]TMN23167.1 GMC family oxidoreductase [Lentibacillus cibarius]TRM11952.1 GMC family oxidoreductase [Lentibacillus cibarius]